MKIVLPELCLVLLVGPSGCGKSTFARRHFKSTEVLSSDFFRGLVSDDEGDQSVSPQAFQLLHLVASKRLMIGRLTVIDATNVQPDARRALVGMAGRYHVGSVAIVFPFSEKFCRTRNLQRTDRKVDPAVITLQYRQLKAGLHRLKSEGYVNTYSFSSPRSLDSAEVIREAFPVNRKFERGPFDIIGDIHGCYDELNELLIMLGYRISNPSRFSVVHPEGRKLIFLGDLVNRGPRTVDVLRLVMDIVERGQALCLPGNHDKSLLMSLRAKKADPAFRAVRSQLARESRSFQRRVYSFLRSLVSHYVLDDGRLVVAHAGLKRHMQGRMSPQVDEVATFGETYEDPSGKKVRYNWAADYKGPAQVVYGHTPVRVPAWINNTVDIDTGCVYGGSLTALRYPENQPVSVLSRRVYYHRKKPLPYAPGR